MQFLKIAGILAAVYATIALAGWIGVRPAVDRPNEKAARELLDDDELRHLEKVATVAPAERPARRPIAKAASQELAIVEHTHQPSRYGAGDIIGQIRNDSGRSFGYVRVDVSTYNDGGKLVENSYDNALSLGPGETWNFSVLLQHNFATYKIMRVQGR